MKKIRSPRRDREMAGKKYMLAGGGTHAGGSPQSGQAKGAGGQESTVDLCITAHKAMEKGVHSTWTTQSLPHRVIKDKITIYDPRSSGVCGKL